MCYYDKLQLRALYYRIAEKNLTKIERHTCDLLLCGKNDSSSKISKMENKSLKNEIKTQNGGKGLRGEKNHKDLSLI